MKKIILLLSLTLVSTTVFSQTVLPGTSDVIAVDTAKQTIAESYARDTLFKDFVDQKTNTPGLICEIEVSSMPVALSGDSAFVVAVNAINCLSAGGHGESAEGHSVALIYFNPGSDTPIGEVLSAQ